MVVEPKAILYEERLRSLGRVSSKSRRFRDGLREGGQGTSLLPEPSNCPVEERADVSKD